MKNTTQRIDAVWDKYPEENNFKALRNNDAEMAHDKSRRWQHSNLEA
jgi:hypothetical protein